MTQRENWSFSRLSRYTGCGEYSRRWDAERERLPGTSPMVRGTAVHHVAAVAHGRQLAARQAEPRAALRLKILRESLPSIEEAGDLAAAKFEDIERTEGIQAPAGMQKSRIGLDKDLAVAMSRRYTEAYAPYFDPVAIEHKVVVEPRDSDLRLTGIIDLISMEQDIQDGTGQIGHVINDLKTGEREPPRDAAEKSDQLTMYALLYRLAFKRMPAKVALNHVLSGTRYSPSRVVTQESTRTGKDLEVIVNRLNNAAAGARAGVYIANGPGSWRCSAKWCPYFASCRYVRQP